MDPSPRTRSTPRRLVRGRRTPGVAATDVLAACAAGGVLLALIVPAVAAGRDASRLGASLDNLRELGTAHAAYAADWNDRQWTAVVDTITAWGDDARDGFLEYANFLEDFDLQHPPVTLGRGALGPGQPAALFAYRHSPAGSFNVANARLTEPIVLNGPNASINRFLGSFRFANDARLTPYLGGRFYDPVFYAPADEVVGAVVEPLFDDPAEYVRVPTPPGVSGLPYFASYVLSPAAMFDPAVMAARRNGPGGPEGGWTDPWSLDTGLRSPAVSQARHPGLKTRMLEHHWLQPPPPTPCLEGFRLPNYPAEELGIDGCEPPYFNHGLASAPATLFFDGSTRLLPNAEALVADEILQRAAGGAGYDGTWSRSTPLSKDGYYNELALEPLGLSHHVLTADGILGRDTLDPAALDGEGAEAILRRRGLAAATTGDARPPAPTPLTRRLSAWLSPRPDPGPHRD